jgi:DNA-binding IclR family transcriptional regulator
MVQQDAERGKYRLGFGLVRLARRVNVQLELTEQARPLTDRLAHGLGESINVAVLREHFAVNVVQSRGQSLVVSQNWIGQLTPLHATSSGKVLLAHLDPVRQDELLDHGLDRFTPHTHSDPAALKEELHTILRDGHAVSYGELEEGLNAAAVPVRGEDGRVIAALSASGPAYRLSPERLTEVLTELVDTAAKLSRRMGHWGGEELVSRG